MKKNWLERWSKGSLLHLEILDFRAIKQKKAKITFKKSYE